LEINRNSYFQFIIGGKMRLSCFAFLLVAFAFPGNVSSQEGSNIKYIDPTIGNIAPLLNTNRPVVHLPNQMVRVFPTRQDYLDDQITGFPMLALNVITPQVVFSVKPSKGEITDTSWNRRMTYDYDLEINRPWYYFTILTDDDIKVEFTAGARTGIYRFTFPEGVRKNLLLTHYYADGLYEISNGNTITGTEFVIENQHNQKGKAFVYGEFSGKPATGKMSGEKNWGKYTVLAPRAKPSKMNGEKIWASYAENDQSVVEFRYAISFISCDQAKINFRNEVGKTTFEELMNSGKAEWEKVIGQIKVEGGTEAQKRSFYTALYRCYVRMVNISEDGKYFSGYDKEIHTDKRPFYTDDYSWGNFTALHPLRMILDPGREADMLQSYVRMYNESGWMPDYPRHYGDREGMFGFHSSIMFLDAWRKGIRNFDIDKAFEGMLKSAEKATMLPSRNGPKGALEDFYNEKGYYPALHPGEPETDPVALGKRGQQRSAVAVTLANCYDNWALSEMAKELGKTEISNKYASKTTNYKNLWNNELLMFLPKDNKGNWIDINPKTTGGDYYNENNGWTYIWQVQHDVEGLIALMGGKEKFEQRLDQFFREDIESRKVDFWYKFQDMTGLTGQFSMGNQLTFFIPYLYNYTNAPWKTQKWTRFLLNVWFKDDIFGVPGDEDGGAMSAFVVFSSMGFYPVKPGVPIYTITSPLFNKVSISLPNGKTFTLIANKCSSTNKYIQSARLNGKLLSSPFFSHDDLLNGGTLVLEMGEKPVTKKNFEVDASCYPWQVHDETITRVLDNVTQLAGVNGIYLIALMHKEHRPFVTDKFPLNPVRSAWDAEDSRIYWKPEAAIYGKIKPLMSDTSWIRDTDWLKLVIDSAHGRGLKAGAEISHTPIPASILKINPAYQQKDIDGNLKGGICPNNPDVMEYLLAIFGDLAKNYDVDWIQTCMYLFNTNTCYCDNCQKEARANGFDLTAAIPILKADPKAEPQLSNWITFRRNSTTKVYKLISDRIHSYKPGCDFRINDVRVLSENPPDSAYGLFFQDLRKIINSCVIQSHTEQNGKPDETFSSRKSWIALNSKLLGKEIPLLSGVAVRLGATPELIKAGIRVAVDNGVNGIAIKHYDGSSYSQLRAVRNGLSEAGVAGYSPVTGIEAETMSLSGYFPARIYSENGISTDGTGTAKASFSYPSGKYTAVISYIDARDGQGTIELYVGRKKAASWKLDEDVECWCRKAIRNISINKGDEIKLVGIRNGKDSACIDFIEFVRQF
jgi:predicted alpha-1,2-mannosidase